MKKLILPIFCLALLAAPAFAQDPTADETVEQTAQGGSGGFDDTRHRRGGRGGDSNDRPVAPVPEPGTMALASMGLIALGVAARGRRR
jgi:PEP-CTERM motif